MPIVNVKRNMLGDPYVRVIDLINALHDDAEDSDEEVAEYIKGLIKRLKDLR